ncbi:MAG: AraC family transcriptional regulator [Flaviaesturariibacter sp.]|nr:AraC family transcriptional regulator [Flaviaesturariibacter sp.]
MKISFTPKSLHFIDKLPFSPAVPSRQMPQPTIKSTLPLTSTTGYDLISETVRQVPDALQYTIRRFLRPGGWAQDDMGLLHYEYDGDGAGHGLHLQFCIAGNAYCPRNGVDCHPCALHSRGNCPERLDSVDTISISFAPSFLTQFVRSLATTATISERLLTFRHTTSFSKAVPLCNKTRSLLEGLLNHGFTGSLENIFVNAQLQMLLVYSLNCMIGEKEPETFECRFLANADDREKIRRAREVLLQHIGEPITIKELSRKVAINECYLKKGFKELFGTTIFDFYQGQRMEHAKYLLYEKGLSVTDVSVLLGYSSISHFSTAFKKQTGLKPCELLLREGRPVGS